MILRRNSDTLLLISQTAHAHLAAQLAEQIGNARFASPLPRAAVLKAIELHDSGWPAHDQAPTLNDRGLPTDVFEMPLERALPIWSSSTRIAAAADPYAGLLVSLHGMGLSLRATIGSPLQKFAITKFQHNEVEVQEELRRRLSLRTDLPLRHGLAEPGRSSAEDLLLGNFRLLEFADQLSLNLCFDEVRLPLMEKFFCRPGEGAIDLNFQREAEGWFSVSPWPFETEVLELGVAAKRIAARPYQDTLDLSRALAAAEEEILPVRLRRAGELPA